MSSYCRITGRSRGLPKPHYFPLLPPISPADAKRLCRITGKSYGLPSHHYTPVLTAMSRTRVKVQCHITSKSEGQETHHFLPAGVEHTIQKGFRYLFPLIDTNIELLNILEGKSLSESNHKFIYTVDEHRCTLVLPGQLEAAIRDGDVRDIMLAKECDKILIKLRKGATVEIDVKDSKIDQFELFEGEGPSKETIIKQKKRKIHDNNEWRRKIFEDKEKQAMSEEERQLEIRSKRIKVKLDGLREHPVVGSWKNVRIEQPTVQINMKCENKLKNTLRKLQGVQKIEKFVDNGGKPFVHFLPQPMKVESQIVDLNHSLPGIIQQPVMSGDYVIGLPIAKVVAPFQPFIADVDSNVTTALNELSRKENYLQNILQKQNLVQQKNSTTLLPAGKVAAAVKAISKLFGKATHNNKQKFQHGVKVFIDDKEVYIPGQFIHTSSGDVFIPGNVIETSSGLSFVPGFSVQTEVGNRFLPGLILKDKNNLDVFVAGQTALTRDGEKFVQGQVVSTQNGVRFMPGQTVITNEGLKFVPGQVIKDHTCENGHKFVPGQIIMTTDGPQFVTGQCYQNLLNAETTFVPGQSILNENCNWEFIPGHNVKTEDGSYTFVAGKEITYDNGLTKFIPGQFIIEDGSVEHFIPGITMNDDSGNIHFIPGMEIETADGAKFVEGILTNDGDSFAFSAGHISKNDQDSIQFENATHVDGVTFHDTQAGVTTNSVPVSSADGTEVFGHLVQSTQGVEFFPGETTEGLPAGKVIPGRLVKGKEMRFIPGTMQNGNFIPGQFVNTNSEEKFIPGQVIETQEGPKFVPGQVLQTRTGPKFVPGQTMETENGPKFIPGQIIETKRGPTFIPGQVIYTEDEGSQFVPGQLVDTVEGPRFVPGRVVETGDHVTFIPGQIVETEEGLKFVAPDLEDDPEGGYQFTVQGFEVAQEELMMIGNSIPHACFIGEMAIDSKTLQQLAEAGMAVGRQMPVDIPSVNIRSLPVTETACKVADNLDIDASHTVKMSHILSNLLQIKQAGTSLSPEDINDEDLRLLVHIALDNNCHKESCEFLQSLGDALENTIKIKGHDKLETISALHDASMALVSKVKERSVLVNNAASAVASKLQLNSAYMKQKVGQILSNLHQIKKANILIPRKHIKDKNLKMLINLIADCDTNLNEPELLHALGFALENTVKVDMHHSLETIETLCILTSELSSTARKCTLPLIGTALSMISDMKIDPANSVKVMLILNNLQNLSSMKIAFSEKEIGDENGQILLDLIQTSNVLEPKYLLQSVVSALENISKLDPQCKQDTLSKLCTLTSSLLAKGNKKLDSINNFVQSMVKKMDLTEDETTKINDTVHGLLQLKQSIKSLPKLEKVEDNTVKDFMKFVTENKDLTEDMYMKAMEDYIENFLCNSGSTIQNIDNIYSSVIVVTNDVNEKLKATTEAAVNIATTLNLDSTDAIEMTNILSNLNEINESGLAIENEEINNEHLKLLLNLSSGGIQGKNHTKMMMELGKALENTIKVNHGPKKQIITSLKSLTAALSMKVTDKAKLFEEKAQEIAKKRKLNKPQLVKVVDILMNIQKIKQSNISLTNIIIEDKNIKALLSEMMEDCATKTVSQSLEKITATIDKILSINAENKIETIDTLKAFTGGLVSDLKNTTQEATRSAQILSQTLDLDTPDIIKLSHIISNVKKLQENNMVIPDKFHKDKNLVLLLNLTAGCGNSKDSNMHFIAAALEKTLLLDIHNEIKVIDLLYNSTNSLLSETDDEVKKFKNIANEVASNMKVGEVEAIKISQILVNIQQIESSSLKISHDNGKLQKVLDFAAQYKGNKNDINFISSMANKVEQIIMQNPECTVQSIDELCASTNNLASEVQENTKFITKEAYDMAKDFDVGQPQLVQISHILTNLQKIQQTGLLLHSGKTQNANMELLLNLSLASNFVPSNVNSLTTLSEALKSTLSKVNSGDYGKIIENLCKKSHELASAAQNKLGAIEEIAGNLLKENNLEPPQAAKLIKILTNIQQLYASNCNLKVEGITNKHLKMIMSSISEYYGNTSDIELLGIATNVLNETIKSEVNPSEIIDNLLKSTSKITEQAQNRLLTTAQTVLLISKNHDLNTPELIKLNKIINNLYSIQKTNLKIPNKDIPHSDNINTILYISVAKDNTSDTDIIKSLADAFLKTTDINPEKNCDNIDKILASTNTLVLEGKQKFNLFHKKAYKLANQFKLNEKSSEQLFHLLCNLQNIHISGINIQKLDITNSNLKLLLQATLKSDPKKGVIEFIAVVGKALEQVLEQESSNNIENINSLYSLSNELIIKQKGRSSLTANITCGVSNDLNLSKPCLVQVNDILSNLQIIQESGILHLANICDSDMELLLGLSIAREDISEDDMIKKAAHVLETNLAMNLEKQPQLINKLHNLTNHLATKSRESIMHQAKVTEKISENLNLNMNQAPELTQVLTNLQQIKSLYTDIHKLHFPNERVEKAMTQIMGTNLINDETFFDNVGQIIQDNIQKDDIRELKAFTSKLAKEGCHKMQISMESAVAIANDFNVNTIHLVKISHILSNLEKIKNSNVVAILDENPDCNLEMLLTLTLDGDNDRDESKIFKKLTRVLQRTLSYSLEDSSSTIDTIHDLTNHLITQVDKQSDIIKTLANKVIEKLNINQLKVPGVLDIISNLQQLKASKINPDSIEDIDDKYIKKIIKDVLNIDGNPKEINFLQAVAEVLENNLNVDSIQAVDKIDQIHQVTNNLISKIYSQSNLIAETSVLIANSMKLKSSDLSKVNHIMHNLQTIQSSNFATSSDNIRNQDVELLLNFAKAGITKENQSYMVQALAEAFQKTIKLIPSADIHKIIDSINDVTSKIATKAIHTSSLYELNAVKLLQDFGVDDSYLPKVSKILSNLQKIILNGSNFSSNVPVIENKLLKTLINFVEDCKINKLNGNFINIARESLENIFNVDPDHKVQNINNLYTLTCDLVLKMDNQVLLTTEAAYEVASALNKSTAEVIMMSCILSDMHYIMETDIIIPCTEKKQNNVELLLNLSLASQNGIHDVDIINTLANALQKTITADDNKYIIKDLHEAIPKLISQIKDKLPNVEKNIDKIVSSCGIDRAHSRKFSKILNNVSVMQEMNANVYKENIEIDKLRSVCAELISIEDKSVESIINVIETFLLDEAETKYANIDYLLSMTENIASKAKDEKLLITETALIMSKQFGMSTPQVLKLVNIISNLHKIKESCTAIPYNKVADGSLQLVLDLASKPITLDCNSEKIRLLADVLVDNINVDIEQKVELIDKLDTLIVDLANNAQHQSKLCHEKAIQMAKKLNVGETYSPKLFDILSNCQQIKISNIDISKYSMDEKWITLINAVQELDDHQEIQIFLDNLGDLIEVGIRADPEHKLQNITSLCTVLNSVITKEKNKSYLIAQSALNITQDLNMSTLQMIKVNNILHNLYGTIQANFTIPAKKIGNKKLHVLLNLVLNSDSQYLMDDEIILKMSNALKETLEIEPVQTSDTIDSLHSLTTDIIALAQTERECIEMISKKLCTNLGLDCKSIPALKSILSDLKYYKIMEVDISHKNGTQSIADIVRNCLNVNHKDNNGVLESFARNIEIVLSEKTAKEKEQLLYQIEAHLKNTTLKEKQKSYFVMKKAVEVATELKFNTEDVIKMSAIISNLEQIKGGSVSSLMDKVCDCDLKLLMHLAQEQNNILDDFNYIQSLKIALQKTVEININRQEVINKLNNLASIVLSDFKEKQQQFDKTSLEVTKSLKIDDFCSSKIKDILCNIQSITKLGTNNLPMDSINEELFQLLQIGAKCDDNSDAQFLNVMKMKIIDAIQKNPGQELEKIDELLNASTCLIHNWIIKKSEVAKLAHTIASDFQLDSSEVIKMSDALLNLQQIREMNVPVNIDKIKDDNVKLLVNFAMSYGIDNETKLATLSEALYKSIKLEPQSKIEAINLLANISTNLVKQANTISINIKTILRKLSDQLGIDTKSINKVESILSGILNLKQSNVEVPLSSIMDNNLKILMNMIEAGRDLEDAKFLENIGDALENILKVNLVNKVQTVDILYNQILDLQSKISKKSAQLTLASYEIVKQLNIDESCAVIINSILSGLKQVRQLESFISYNDIKDQNLKVLFKHLTLCNNDLESVEFIQLLSSAVENTVAVEGVDKENKIENLWQLTRNLILQAQNKSLLIDQLASKISIELRVDKSKVQKLLNNLRRMRHSSICISNGNLKDKNIEKLLSYAGSNIDDDEQFIAGLEDIMQKIIKDNIQNKNQIMKTLCISTSKIVADFKEKESLIAEIAQNVAFNMDIEGSSIHISHILDNLKQLKLSKIAIFGNELEDKNLKILFNLALVHDADVDSPEFLQTLGHALEATVKIDDNDSMEKVFKFHTMTYNLVNKVQEHSKLLDKVASTVANKLNVEKCEIKDILSNLKEIVLSNNYTEIDDDIEDNDVKTLLKLAFKYSINLEDTSMEFLQTMGNSLEDIIQISLEHRSQKINTLHAHISQLADKAREKYLLCSTTACKIVDKLNLDTSHSIIVNKILLNLQQIRHLGVILSGTDITDKNLELILKQTLSADSTREDSRFLSEIAETLENLLDADPKHKLDVLHSLQIMSAKFLSDIQEHPPNKIQLLKNLVQNNLELDETVVEKLSSILDANEMQMCIAFQHMSKENPDFINKVLHNAATILNDKSVDEKKAVEALHRAIVKAVGETSEQKVTQALKTTEGDDFRCLVVDAIGLAKALGMNDVVRMLSDVLRDSNTMPILARDKIVMEVLKRLTVMRQLAERRPNFRGALHDLQFDPYAARNDPRLRELVRESAVLMVIPEESMVLRSSADIPSCLLLGDNTLAVEDFMVKSRQTGKTFLILKRGLQMVIPREAAKDVLTGKVPYTVLDENGIHHFTQLHVFNALKLPRIATNRFSNYGFSPKISSKQKSTESMDILSRCSSVCPDDSHRYISNASCSTQEAIASHRSSTPLRSRNYGEYGYRC